MEVEGVLPIVAVPSALFYLADSFQDDNDDDERAREKEHASPIPNDDDIAINAQLPQIECVRCSSHVPWPHVGNSVVGTRIMLGEC